MVDYQPTDYRLQSVDVACYRADDDHQGANLDSWPLWAQVGLGVFAGLSAWWLVQRLSPVLKRPAFWQMLQAFAVISGSLAATLLAFWFTDSWEAAAVFRVMIGFALVFHGLVMTLSFLSTAIGGAGLYEGPHGIEYGSPTASGRVFSGILFAVCLTFEVAVVGLTVKTFMEMSLQQSFVWLGRQCPDHYDGKIVECLWWQY